ncbi:hypothetical protein ACFWUP_03490 [Nocardia sp. NPDC058658]|uniref:hypothetical protein n=1 Tax=Nocardia sp. NPDC058658 TaxID=3346580 RepID=UPI003657F734
MRLRPLVIDALIVMALMTVAVMLGQEATAQGWPALDVTGYVLVGLVNLPLAPRNRAPIAVCVTVDVAWLVYITAGYWPVVNSFGPMLALYTVASLRRTRVAAVSAVVMAAIWTFSGLLHDNSVMASVVAQAVVFSAVIWRFGHLARRSARLAEQLRREQLERAAREVAEERGRIARELIPARSDCSPRWPRSVAVIRCSHPASPAAWSKPSPVVAPRASSRRPTSTG